MKHAILFVTFVFCFLTGCSKKETVIINPEYDNSNASEWLQFSKIELTDTATIVFADVYNRPNNWIIFSSGSTMKGSNGKTYRLIRSDGFELDREVYMPESGNISFKIYFEPIDKGEKTIDYWESDNENDWRICGIKLYTVQHAEPVRCVLKGEVVDRPQSSRMMYLRQGEDARTMDVTYIPIREGKFEYVLHTEAEQMYELIFYDEYLNGAYRPTSFIAENGTTHFTLYPTNKWQDNLVEGGRYNETYQTVTKKLNTKIDSYFQVINGKQDSLMKEEKFFTPEVYQLMQRMNAMSTDDPNKQPLIDQYLKIQSAGKDLMPEAIALQEEAQKTYKSVIVDNELEYAKEHPDIAGYSLLVDNIRKAVEGGWMRLDASPMFDIYHDIYEKKYPDHPYTIMIEGYIQASAVKVGNPCPDIIALDSDGREVGLTKLVAGKITLIHLWASWCGPCRKHGMEMIPVYEMYKDKGFTVVGIARERSKTTMPVAAEQDKYPWVNLLELNDRNQIWTKFGIGNAGGGDFLIDANGNFLAVNSSPEEVKKILHDLLD